MGSLYSEHPTWLHRCAAGYKLAALALLGTVLFLLDSLAALGLASLLAAALWISLGAATQPVRRLMVAVLVASLLVAAFHLWMGQPVLAATSALRLACASTLGLALTLSTRPADLLQVLEALLAPLGRLGLPTERVALQLGLMLRFTEHFFVQWKKLDEAHRLRTGRAGGLRLLAPLTLQMLHTARRVADALLVRLGH